MGKTLALIRVTTPNYMANREECNHPQSRVGGGDRIQVFRTAISLEPELAQRYAIHEGLMVAIVDTA